MKTINHTQLLDIHGGKHSGIGAAVEHLHHVMIVQEAINYVVGFYLNGPAEDDYVGHAIVGAKDATVGFFTTCAESVMSWTSGSHCE